MGINSFQAHADKHSNNTTVFMASLCNKRGQNLPGLEDYYNAATELGTELAKQDTNMSYGGSNIGLMGSVSDAFRKAAVGTTKKILAVALKLYKDVLNYPQDENDVEVVANDINDRKKGLLHFANKVIALPGGWGTLDEIFHAIEENRTFKQGKKIGFLNTNGYWDKLFEFLRKGEDLGFMKPGVLDDIIVEKEPRELIQKMFATA